MKNCASVKVWNFDLPPYPREGVFHLDMSPCCQVNRLLTFEAGRLAQLHQLDVLEDPVALARFQRDLRKKLWEKFGCRYDHELPLEVKKFGVVRQGDVTVTKLIYQSRPGIFVTALLYEPGGKGPFPAVLQMHGHNPQGKFGPNPQAMALGLAKSGFVCLTVDAFGAYERADTSYAKQNHGGVLGASLLNIGETLMGAQIVDNMRGIDLLRTLPNVKKDRIGATGASGGGNQTMWLSAMDTRIAAAMPVVSVGSFESYVYGMNCVCELLPDGLTITEESGVLALIAPRPLRIANALYDCNHDFSAAQMLRTYHPVERLYWKLGVPQNISFNVADRVHGMTDRQRESALGFFAFALKGEGSGNPLPEPEYDVFPEEELHLFRTPDERKSCFVRSIQEHCRIVGEELRKNYLTRESIRRAASVRELKALLRLRELPGKMTLHRFSAVDGTGRAALEAKDHTIPFLIREGSVPGKFRIVLHPEGKAALDTHALAAAAKDGATLILPDLFGTGETAQPNHTIGLHHQFFRQLLWIGRSLTGEWTFDLLALVRMLKKEFSAEEIHVTGLLETGFVALCANVLTAGVSGVTAVDSPGSLKFDARTVDFTAKSPFEKFLPGAIYSLALSIPDFLKWGDVSLVAALGHAPAEFLSPRTSDGTPLSPSEVRSLKKEITQVRGKLA
ncbi:MAG: acetylxylan esterase [Lentisphaeria bacterium]|nr:acetylxylan esterase [Lentisphaeria bacterium]